VKPRDRLPHRLGSHPFSKVVKTREEVLYGVVLMQCRLPQIPDAGRARALQNQASSVRAARDATGLVATPVAPRRCAWLAGLMLLLALSLLVCFVWVD
jgi:hypothetical protein